MSLEQLTATTTVDVYPLTQTKNAMGETVETLGTRKAKGVACRMVPIAIDDDKQFDETAQLERYAALFSTNPSLDEADVLVWNGKVWRIRTVTNQSGMGWMWRVVVEHHPLVEIGAP